MKDVYKILKMNGYTTKNIVKRFDEDDSGQIPIIDKLYRKQNLHVFNESILYNVILISNKAKVKSFRKWISSKNFTNLQVGNLIYKDIIQGGGLLKFNI